MNVRQVIPEDAIPSIDDPEFGSAYVGQADDDVIAVDADPPRAYPVRILNYHEIVNDVVDGVPLAVTWCPLCGSAVVYDRRVDGRTLTFGVSGKLADDVLVMYDRETGSEWKQSLGTCIAGQYEGTELDVRPSRLTSWERFTAARPDGVVLQPPGTKSEAASETDDPASVDYSMEPYEEYFAAEGFGLGAHRGTGGRTWDRDDIDAKATVLGVVVDDEACGFPRPGVEAAGGVARATVGGRAVVVFAVTDGIHAFEDPGYDFVVEDDVVSADGTTWQPTSGESDDGRRLDPVAARRLFAFGWQDDHGPDAFWEP